MEVPFFVYADALKRIQPDMRRGGAGIMGAFDKNRNVIENTAAKIYARHRKGSYKLGPTDF